MNEKTININNIDDGLEGNMWQYIAPDFSFKTQIHSDEREAFPVHQYGVLIHKHKNKEDMFPTIRYHLIMLETDGAKAYELELRDIKPKMQRNLALFMVKNKMLPYGCKHVLSMKNGKVKIKYEPNEYTSYSISLNPSKIGLTQTKVEGFSSVEKNNLEKDVETQISIAPIIHKLETANIRNIAMENENKVFIWDACIDKIDRRIATYREYDSIWYFIHLVNGTVSKDKKSERLPFTEINIKISDNAMDTYNFEIGNKINCKGKLKETQYLGLFIQGIRKFEKL